MAALPRRSIRRVRRAWRSVRRQLSRDNGRRGAVAARMSPEEYVDQLYRAVLGRPVDESGLAAWKQFFLQTGDATGVLAGLIESEEYRGRSGATEGVSGLVQAALRGLDRRPRVVDVGAQSLEREVHIYAPLMELVPVDVIGFDPLSERLEQRMLAEAQGGGELTLLPFAIGDGDVHTLHVNNEDSTSSLFPLNPPVISRLNHLATLRTVRTQEVTTRRLDDVLPSGPVDLLKLDVQGAELMVLRNASATLERTGVVHCEVSFVPMYVGQPLFGDIAEEMARHGFFVLDLTGAARYHHLGSQVTGPDRLVWADAVFVKESDDPGMLISQALVMAAVYGKWSVAEDMLIRAGQVAGQLPR